ncbi:MAG: hypothetical protein JZD41_01125 [Thermoproteus sp.]|nr:hypothetical protein [Thermoproteus sp.]
MNVAVVVEETSDVEPEPLYAQLLAKWLGRLGHKAWLFTSIFHDGEAAVDRRTVELSEGGYVVLDLEAIPLVRVLSAKTSHGRISLKALFGALRSVDEAHGLDAIVAVGSGWNGPEEAARWIAWKKEAVSIGEGAKVPRFCLMPFYVRGAEGVLEYVAKRMWDATALPSVVKAADCVFVQHAQEAEELRRLSPKAIVEVGGGLDDDAAAAVDELRRDKLYVTLTASALEAVDVSALVEAAERAGLKVASLADPKRRRIPPEVSAGGPTAELAASSLIFVDSLEVASPLALLFMYARAVPISISPRGSRWLIRDGVDGIGAVHPRQLPTVLADLAKRRDALEKMAKNARERAAGFLMSRAAERVAEALQR